VEISGVLEKADREIVAMTRRQHQQRARRAAFLALDTRKFVVSAQEQEREATRAAVMAEMRRQADEFSWRKPATPLKSTGFSAVNGNGHAGAINC
jgi:squalene cyclase